MVPDDEVDAWVEAVRERVRPGSVLVETVGPFVPPVEGHELCVRFGHMTYLAGLRMVIECSGCEEALDWSSAKGSRLWPTVSELVWLQAEHHRRVGRAVVAAQPRCQMVTDFDDSIGGEGEIVCGSALIVSNVNGGTAVCAEGHRWVRCDCDRLGCTGWVRAR